MMKTAEPNERTSNTLCKYFMNGACNKGEDCHFKHDLRELPNLVCTHFLKGDCAYGDKCRYSHVRPDWKPKKEVKNPNYKPPEIKKPIIDDLEHVLPISQLRLSGAVARSTTNPRTTTINNITTNSDAMLESSQVSDNDLRTRSPIPIDLPADPFGELDNASNPNDHISTSLSIPSHPNGSPLEHHWSDEKVFDDDVVHIAGMYSNPSGSSRDHPQHHYSGSDGGLYSYNASPTTDFEYIHSKAHAPINTTADTTINYITGNTHHGSSVADIHTAYGSYHSTSNGTGGFTSSAAHSFSDDPAFHALIQNDAAKASTSTAGGIDVSEYPGSSSSNSQYMPRSIGGTSPPYNNNNNNNNRAIGAAADAAPEADAWYIPNETTAPFQGTDDFDGWYPGSTEDNGMSINTAAQYYGNPHVPSLCWEFYTTGLCSQGDACSLEHGELCEMCEHYALHPTDTSLRDQHIAECTARHERLQARLRSAHVECGICLEVVLEKVHGDRKFGLLNCEHSFCLKCIRDWRQNYAAGVDVDSALRTCPICRTTTHFITPCTVWPSTPEEKEAIISGYKSKLASIDCRYFNYGEGTCPFGTCCMYRHAFHDGRLEEENAPRRVAADEGEVRVVQPVRLSDFIVIKSGKVRGRRR